MFLALYMKVVAGSSILIVISALFGLIIFPSVLRSQIKKQMSLSPKTDVRKMWEKVPFPLEFSVFVFNYTNAEEVQNGAIPVVKEIGPYYFDEWKEKVQVKDVDENDTISFRKQDTFIFRPDLTKGFTGEEEVVLPNIFLMSLATMTLRDKPAMMQVLGKALHGIFDRPSSVFMTVKVMDLLFRGVNINCDRKEFASKAVCTALKKEAADLLVFESRNQYKFSIFGMQNSTPGQHIITVKRGTKNIMDVGQVIALDGESKQYMWKDHCNEIEGTDGTIFAPFLTPNDHLTTYADSFCRTFKPRFHQKSEYDGISTNRYLSNIGDIVNDPELQCYCKEPDSCTKGLMDLAPCTKAPLYVSMPHYYDSDEELLQHVKGLNPDEDEHMQFIDFEPITGTPLKAKLRVMFSLQLIKSDKFDLLEKLPNTMAPLFWVQEGIELNKTFTSVMKGQLFKPMKIVKILSWLLISVGIVGVLIGVSRCYKEKSMGLSHTKITPDKIKSASNYNKEPTNVTS